MLLAHCCADDTSLNFLRILLFTSDVNTLPHYGLSDVLWGAFPLLRLYSVNITHAIFLSDSLPCVFPAISSQYKCHSMVPSSTSSLTNNLLCCHVVCHQNSTNWHATL